MSDPIIDLHPSSLASASDCELRAVVDSQPELFLRAGYVLKERRQNVGAAVGQGVHTATASLLTDRIEDRESDIDGALEKGVESFKKEIEGGFLPDELTPDRNSGETQVLKMTRALWGIEGYKRNPVWVERNFKATINSEFRLVGRPDALMQGGWLDDNKTGKKIPVPILQLGAYSLLMQGNAIPTPRLTMTYQPRRPADKDAERPIVVDFDKDIAQRIAKTAIKRLLVSIPEFKETQDPTAFMINPMSVLCSEKFCRAFATDLCPVWKYKPKTNKR